MSKQLLINALGGTYPNFYFFFVLPTSELERLLQLYIQRGSVTATYLLMWALLVSQPDANV